MLRRLIRIVVAYDLLEPLTNPFAMLKCSQLMSKNFNFTYFLRFHSLPSDTSANDAQPHQSLPPEPMETSTTAPEPSSSGTDAPNDAMEPTPAEAATSSDVTRTFASGELSPEAPMETEPQEPPVEKPAVAPAPQVPAIPAKQKALYMRIQQKQHDGQAANDGNASGSEDKGKKCRFFLLQLSLHFHLNSITLSSHFSVSISDHLPYLRIKLKVM